MWEIQMCIGGRWENVWTEEVDGTEQPQTFPTHRIAREELHEHFEDMKSEGMEFDSKEYRISLVQKTSTVPVSYINQQESLL